LAGKCVPKRELGNEARKAVPPKKTCG